MENLNDNISINIIGAGLAGLSAAIDLAGEGISCRLISLKPSERAQSVMAEGGINAALDTMGEGDTTLLHYKETLKGGVYLADEAAVKGLIDNAPEIVNELLRLGVPFDKKDGKLVLRAFGGQKKRRTAYAMSSTGKVIMTSLIDRARYFEKEGLVTRYPHSEALCIKKDAEGAGGVIVRDIYTDDITVLDGPVIIACGGLNGLFPGLYTGSAANEANLQAALFSQGVEFGNLEFIQYHPTTVKIAGKRMLISEAARGEGGRLFIMRDGRPWYFMEEECFPLKNLMPRDVVSREMNRVMKLPGCEGSVYLDMRTLSDDIWENKLADMRAELLHYLGLDIKNEPVPVSPGIHFFMGGILVDKHHRTNIRNLYAAGECACIYHGANRLGGNSMLGAIYGGKTAARTAADELKEFGVALSAGTDDNKIIDKKELSVRASFSKRHALILKNAMGIVRDGDELSTAIKEADELLKEALSGREYQLLNLGKAVLLSAYNRKESRGAHVRGDFPELNDELYKKTSVAYFKDGEVNVLLKDISGSAL